jgi:hypothetical protein
MPPSDKASQVAPKSSRTFELSSRSFHATHTARRAAGFLPSRLPPRPHDVGVAICLQDRVRWRRVVWRVCQLSRSRRHVRLLPPRATRRAVPLETVPHTHADGAVLRLHAPICVRCVLRQCAAWSAARTGVCHGQHACALLAILYKVVWEQEQRHITVRLGRWSNLGGTAPFGIIDAHPDGLGISSRLCKFIDGF